jgi:hypothetical protein
MADETKAELIADLERARAKAAVNRRALVNDLQLGRVIRQSIERNKGAWLGGSVLFGLLLSMILGGTKRVVVDRKGARGGKAEQEIKQAATAGLLLTGLKMAFNLARPALTKWAMEWISERARRA